MSERWQLPKGFAGNYPAGPGNRQFRRWVYEHAVPAFDFEGRIIEALDLNGCERILDVGCSDGNFLIDLRSRFRHQGFLAGIDPHLNQFGYTSELDAAVYDIAFTKGRAQNLPYAGSSFDVVTSLFVQYAIPVDKQTKAIYEAIRVLTPEGKFVLATSGSANKFHHRLLEKETARQLGIKPPQLMNHSYASEKAATDLPRHFERVERYSQRAEMVFYDKEEAFAYFMSVYSMQDQFQPIPRIRALRPVIETVVGEAVEFEIKDKGYFSDIIDRDFFICTNPKK